jgi:hypothetical protein
MLDVITVAFTHLIDSAVGFAQVFHGPERSTIAHGAVELPRTLASAFDFLDGQFRALEANAAVGSVAERFVHRTTAATERKGSLAREVKLIAAGIDQIDRAFGSLDSIWTVRLYCDPNVSHEFQSSHLAGFE